MDESVCQSCNVKIVNDKGTTRFMCPSCGKTKMIRCESCRKSAIQYKCEECGFTGPN